MEIFRNKIDQNKSRTSSGEYSISTDKPKFNKRGRRYVLVDAFQISLLVNTIMHARLSANVFPLYKEQTTSEDNRHSNRHDSDCVRYISLRT